MVCFARLLYPSFLWVVGIRPEIDAMHRHMLFSNAGNWKATALCSLFPGLQKHPVNVIQ